MFLVLWWWFFLVSVIGIVRLVYRWNETKLFSYFLHRQLNFFQYCSPQIRPDSVQQASFPIDKHADEQVIINIIRNFLIKYINMLVLIQIINIGKIYIILTMWKSSRYFKRPTTKMCKIESYLVQCSLGDWCVTKSQLFTKIPKHYHHQNYLWSLMIWISTRFVLYQLSKNLNRPFFFDFLVHLSQR